MKYFLTIFVLLIAANMVFADADSDKGRSTPGYEFVSYGDVDLRDNNFAARTTTIWPGNVQDYRSHGVLESFNRILLGYGAEIDSKEPHIAHAVNPRLYIELDGSYTSRNVPPENRLTPSFGVEIRPFSSNKPYKWYDNTRFYLQYTGEKFLRSKDYSWYPRNTLLAGTELWAQFGAADPANNSKKWAELYFGGAYYTTKFYLPYGSKGGVHVGADYKYGTVVGHGRYRVMPYAVIDANVDTQSYYWWNRLWAGPGLRIQCPFKGGNKVWLYVEQRWIVNYPQTKPLQSDHVAYNDTWVGIAYAYDLYRNK